jgi:hypothetical protein
MLEVIIKKVHVGYIVDFDVQIYPTLSKAKYNVIDGIYLEVSSKQFNEWIIAMIVITQ